MSGDPILTRDEATGFYVEYSEMTVGEMSIITFAAYPDERWVYHLHRGNRALGDTAEQAIAALSARLAWRIAA